MKKGIQSGILSFVIGFFISTTPHARGDVNINWTAYGGFSRTDVTIQPGERVYWNNLDSYYDLYLTVEGYGSGWLPSGYYTYVTFTSQGNYDFSSDWGDYGTVHVGTAVVNVPPVVTITNPVNHAVFPAPATFTIGVDTSDTQGDYVMYVEFYLGTSAGTNYLNFDLDVPFGIEVSDLGAGNYTLIAVGTDNGGLSTTNAITITVGVIEPIVLSAPRMSGNKFLFDVNGLAVGKTNVLQASTNLSDWIPLKTNVAVSSSTTITNTPGPGPNLFRVIQRP